MERRKRLTSSDFASTLCKCTDRRALSQLTRTLIEGVQVKCSIFRHGLKYERVAVEKFEKKIPTWKQLRVEFLFLCPTPCWLLLLAESSMMNFCWKSNVPSRLETNSFRRQLFRTRPFNLMAHRHSRGPMIITIGYTDSCSVPAW